MNNENLFDNLKVEFKTLTGCNCNCVMCDLYRNINEEKSSAEFDRVYDLLDYLDRSYVSTVKILGGEPLVYFAKLLKLMKKCNLNGFNFEFTTNAILLDNSKIDELIENGLKEITISLDSNKKETHNKLRGNVNAFDKAINALKYISLTYPFVKINVNTVVANLNIGDIPNLIYFVKNLGVKQINLLKLHILNDNCKKLSVTNQQEDELIKKLYELVNKDASLLGFIHYDFPKSKFAGCSYFLNKIVVNQNNTLQPCDKPHFSNDKDMTLNRPLKEILYSKKYLEFLKEKLRKCEKNCVRTSELILSNKEYNLQKKITLNKIEANQNAGKYIKKAAEDIINGKIRISQITRLFEKKFRERFNVKYAVAVASGTIGLHLALRASGIKKGDEVITNPATHISTISSIRGVGAIPVFVKINSRGMFDVLDLRKKLSKNTKAIMPVYMGGFSEDIDNLIRIKKNKKILIIEDACQNLSAFSLLGKKWKQHGTIFDIGIFSFDSMKVFNTFSGGMVVTNNPEFFNRILNLAKYGDSKEGIWGYNVEMDDLRAALGLVNLANLDDNLRIREQNWRSILKLAKRFSWLEPILPQNTEKLNFSFFSARVLSSEIRDFIIDNLAKYNIDISKPDVNKKLNNIKIEGHIDEEIKKSIVSYYNHLIELPIHTDFNQHHLTAIKIVLYLTHLEFFIKR